MIFILLVISWVYIGNLHLPTIYHTWEFVIFILSCELGIQSASAVLLSVGSAALECSEHPDLLQSPEPGCFVLTCQIYHIGSLAS